VKCRDCGEPIQFLGGDKRPYDLTPRIHYANPAHIAAVRKNGAKAKKGQVSRPPEQVVNPAIREAQEGLMNQGWKSRQVQGMLVELPAELLETADAETLILEVFKRRAAELAALTKMGADG
jgi:hypothetical protein